MGKIRQALRNSVIARIFVYIFIFNFFTCQCLAVVPEIFQSRNFKGEDIKNLFGSFDTHGDSISFNLIKESDTFFLDITQRTKFGRETQKRLSTQIRHNSEHEIDVLDFGSNFVFPLLDGRVCLDGVFEEYSGFFGTALDLIITRLHFERDFGLLARNIEIIESLSASKSLSVKKSHSLENNGVFFAPFLKVDTQKVVNRGNIHGEDILLKSSSLKNLKEASIIGANKFHLSASEVFGDSSLISGKNIEISANTVNLRNEAGVIGTNAAKIESKESVIVDASSITAANLEIKTKSVGLKSGARVVGKSQAKITSGNVVSNSSEILGDSITFNTNDMDLDNQTQIEAEKALNISANKLECYRNTGIKSGGVANLKVKKEIVSTDSYFQGKSVNIVANIVDSEKSVILGEDGVQILANKALRTNSSLMKAKNVKIKTESAGFNINSEVLSEEKLELTAKEVLIDGKSNLSSKDAIFNVGLFSNTEEGKLNFSGAFNLSSYMFSNKGSIKGNAIQINTSNDNEDLKPRLQNNLIHSKDVNLNDCVGIFSNEGQILGEKLGISAKKKLLNKGTLEAGKYFSFVAGDSIVNEGYFRSHSDSDISKIYTPKTIVHDHGTTGVAGNLKIKGKALSNLTGTIEARNLEIDLAIKKDGQFIRNNKESSCSQYESNPYSTTVDDYLKTTRQTKERVEDKTDKSVEEIGYLANTLGTIRASRDLSIKCSGAIYNGDKAGIVAKNRVAIDTNGRILNQLGSMISAPYIEVKSQGKLFNTGGSEINASIELSGCTTGLENGIGSKILGGVKLISNESVFNFGEITGVRHPIEISTNECIKNYGTVCSDQNIAFETPKQLFNGGRISGKSVDLQKAYDVTNIGTGIAEGESVLFRNGALLHNTGRISSRNLNLVDVIFTCLNYEEGQQIDFDGILEAEDTISIVGKSAGTRLVGVLKAKNLEFTNFEEGLFSVFNLLINSDQCVDQVILNFPNASLINDRQTVLGINAQILAKNFLNTSRLCGKKNLKIQTSSTLISEDRSNRKSPRIRSEKFPLINDSSIRDKDGKNTILGDSVYDADSVIIDNSQELNSVAIDAGGRLELIADKSIENRGVLEAQSMLLQASTIQHGWGKKEEKKESLPDRNDFRYHYREKQEAPYNLIRVADGLTIQCDRLLNTLGAMDVHGRLQVEAGRLFLNYGGDIAVRGDAFIKSQKFANIIGSAATNENGSIGEPQKERVNYTCIAFSNTPSAAINVLDGHFNIYAPYIVNGGSDLYGANGVFIEGKQTERLLSLSDVTIFSGGFQYTRAFLVNEYNKGRYIDKIAGLSRADTRHGATIQAKLVETVKKKSVPSSISSPKEVIITNYDDLKSDGIIHSNNIVIKTGKGTTKLGSAEKVELSKVEPLSFAPRTVDVFSEFWEDVENPVLDLSGEDSDFIFKSNPHELKIPFTIIYEDGQLDKSLELFQKAKLPFSLEVLEVMALKQMQRSLGTGYLADMPSFLDAAKVSYKSRKYKAKTESFPYLKKYTSNSIIGLISDKDADHGLFFTLMNLANNEDLKEKKEVWALIPQIRLSSKSVSSALRHPAGAVVAQGDKNANVIIDTDGFLHATGAIHADDDIRVRANRGALFETTTYDAMAITQNMFTSRSRGFCGTGIGGHTKYHKVTEWHKIKKANTPMVAETVRGDFIVIIPEKEVAEFKRAVVKHGGNFDIYGGEYVLSPIELAEVYECPKVAKSANRITTLVPELLRTLINGKENIHADVRVFKNTAGRIEALGDIVIKAKDKIVFDTKEADFILAEGEDASNKLFSSKKSKRKLTEKKFFAPETKSGRETIFKSGDEVHLRGGEYMSGKDITISARIAKLESVLGYGTDEFHSKASSLFSEASYDRVATSARISPIVFKMHGDFIEEVLGKVTHTCVQKSCRNERVFGAQIEEVPLQVHETIKEKSSSSGVDFFIPSNVTAPLFDGKANKAAEELLKNSSFASSANNLIHSKNGADIAVNGIATAIAAYDSLKTVLDVDGIGGPLSLFGIGNFGFHHSVTHRRTTHDFTVGSLTEAEGSIEWYATSGDIDITHRVAKAKGNQTYHAAGSIRVNPGQDIVEMKTTSESYGAGFNVFSMNANLEANNFKGRTRATKYQSSSFQSRGTNVFKAGKDINIVIPQITGQQNVFDAMFVNLENKANEEESESKSKGISLSSSPHGVSKITGAVQFGNESSRNTYLNEAYIRSAVDFMRSKVENKGCLVEEITNKGASYRYTPMGEVHKSRNFAIALSGIDMTSPDGFAYSLGRSITAAAASAGVGIAASEAGMGGFVSSVAASLAGAAANQATQDRQGPGLGSNGSVSYGRDGKEFKAIDVKFDREEFGRVIEGVKAKVFGRALDEEMSVPEAVEAVEQEVARFVEEVETEQTKIDATATQIEDTERTLQDEVKAEIGEKEVQNLVKGKDISKENREKVIKSISRSIKKLEKQKAELNLKSPFKQDKVQKASLQTQNELIGEKIQQYSLLSEFLSRIDHPAPTRSNSADNLLQDTYIRQQEQALGMVTGASLYLACEADVMSYQDYCELQYSRLPVDMQNNPEALGRLGTSYAIYKAAANIGHGLSYLDDATGNVVSGVIHKFVEGSEWIGTHTRRFMRDDLGFSQRFSQNTGDFFRIISGIFAPGSIAKGVGSISKIVGSSKFRAALGERLALHKDGRNRILFPSTKQYFRGISDDVELSILNRKYKILELAQANAVEVRRLPDGRVRYYEAEKPAKTAGRIRGAGFVTEFNPKTGDVRHWLESRDHCGNVQIVHVKNINGVKVEVPHYPNIPVDFIKFGGEK